MLIGEDFDKIKIQLFHLELLEPNAFIGDLFLFSVAIYFAYKTNKISDTANFFKYWKWFFLLAAISFLMGGLGHLFYNYWGLSGKYFSWYAGIALSFLAEMSIVSIIPVNRLQNIFKTLSVLKLIFAFAATTYFFKVVDMSIDQSKGLIIPTINSVIGLGLALGVTGVYFQKTLDDKFKYFWISTLIMIPAAVFQSMKINFAQWFDRNDVSHLLMLTTLFLYFKSIEGYSKMKILRN